MPEAVLHTREGSSLKVQEADTFSHVFYCKVEEDRTDKKTPGAPMQLCSISYMKERISLEDLKNVVLERLVAKVFRYRAVPRISERGWTVFDEVNIKDLDLGYHFQEMKQEFNTDSEWSEKLNEFASTRFDKDKPYWKFIIVDKLPCGRPGLVFSTDHLVGDGASFVASTIQNLCEGGAGIKSSKKQRAKPAPFVFTDYVNMFWTGVLVPLLELALPRDTPNKLKAAEAPSEWEFACTKEPLDIQLFKDIKDRIPGATVNDAMLAATSLAIKSYYESINEPIMNSQEDLRATFVVHTRPPTANIASDKWFGNDFVVSSVRYPIHEDGPSSVVAFRNRTRILKASPDAAVRYFIRDRLLSLIPNDKVCDLAVEINCKYSITVSNVFISSEKMTLAGIEIDDIKFLVFTPMGAYFGLSTYAGKVHCNLVVGKSCEANPELVVAAFSKEAKKLHKDMMKLSEKEVKYMSRAITERESAHWLGVTVLVSAITGLAAAYLFAARFFATN
uniref:O-acyltransferase WSD1 C-terminal domain-containing protein n=1 Tax=Mucochytrium quahogii TaxID=96639 RepID=A0A7S2WBT8_9STRA|mmetsp:Transcript_9632/g.15798  ORF Transcript_9632/g.15798 Transcript_9632/m.15798 type:complete len:504 (+) Transcript_9632:230-1741(+)